MLVLLMWYEGHGNRRILEDHMNRTELIKAVSTKTGIPQHTTEKVLLSIFDTIGLSLAMGESVNVRGFGAFDARDRGATTRRNPKTGEIIQVPAKNGVSFRPSDILKHRLNGGRK